MTVSALFPPPEELWTMMYVEPGPGAELRVMYGMFLLLLQSGILEADADADTDEDVGVILRLKARGCSWLPLPLMVVVEGDGDTTEMLSSGPRSRSLFLLS